MVNLFESKPRIMRNKYKTIAAAVVTPLLVVVGAYLAWSCASRAFRSKGKESSRNKKVREQSEPSGGGRRLARSVSMAAIHGGKIALQRLLDFHAFRLDASEMANAEAELENLLSKEQPDIGSLQRAVGKLEMSGKEAEGAEILARALDRARGQRKPHEAYEIEMLLVEMLIYKGDFEEALNCRCLEESMTTDARRPLFKAIIHILLGDYEKKAPIYFEEFREIQNDFLSKQIWEDSQSHKVISNFKEFKKFVEMLKKEILEAKK